MIYDRLSNRKCSYCCNGKTKGKYHAVGNGDVGKDGVNYYACMSHKERLNGMSDPVNKSYSGEEHFTEADYQTWMMV